MGILLRRLWEFYSELLENNFHDSFFAKYSQDSPRILFRIFQESFQGLNKDSSQILSRILLRILNKSFFGLAESSFQDFFLELLSRFFKNNFRIQFPDSYCQESLRIPLKLLLEVFSGFYGISYNHTSRIIFRIHRKSFPGLFVNSSQNTWRTIFRILRELYCKNSSRILFRILREFFSGFLKNSSPRFIK